MLYSLLYAIIYYVCKVLSVEHKSAVCKLRQNDPFSKIQCVTQINLAAKKN